ncbi:ribosome biogenesis factor YjgA, partial [Neisseria sp. SLRRB23]|uniref:ribosome biogenesis factor YjgA n=1 Tax=Neisseria sp. SLRRB23 TaxID=3435199 RepID=UPI003D7F1D34
MFEQEDEWVSKTQMKKQMNDLQDLGMALTKLSNDTLKKIGLDADLYEAVTAYKKITSNGALKRQAQFIGRLMRDLPAKWQKRFFATKIYTLYFSDRGAEMEIWNMLNTWP